MSVTWFLGCLAQAHCSLTGFDIHTISMTWKHFENLSCRETASLLISDSWRETRRFGQGQDVGLVVLQEAPPGHNFGLLPSEHEVGLVTCFHGVCVSEGS